MFHVNIVRGMYVFLLSVVLGAAASALPSDVYVVLDVSGSMKSGGIASEVKSYLDKEVVRTLLRPGDRITVIAFGSDARQVLSKTLESEADKDALAREIAAIRTEDAYTDLGVALEKLDASLSSVSDGTRRPIAVFITDGKNAPPPSSPYSGKDLSVDSRFKDVGRKIAMKGWNLYVIGVGDKTDAPAVAAAVEGSTLVESSSAKTALESEKLTEYAEQSTKAAEEKAAAAASGAAGGASGSSGGKSTASEGGSFPLIAIIIAAAAAIGALIFFVLRARKPKDEETPPPKKGVPLI